MVKIKNTFFIPIGCSCINHFQLDFFCNENQTINHERIGGLLDWAITTPESTIQLFKYFLDGSIKNVLIERKNYIKEKGRVKNTKFDGLYFWHDPDVLDSPNNFEAFQNKINHLVSNMIGISRSGSPSVSIWSNVQPNLFSAVSEIKDWKDFQLSKDHYESIKILALEFFGSSNKSFFITKKEDLLFEDCLREDIITFELARGPDYQGSVGLFAPLIEKLI